ncbi:MAG: helix-turn-helix domain-containing protein [Halanaeroarchaeum sp.]
MAAGRSADFGGHDVEEMADPSVWVELAIDLPRDEDCPLAGGTEPSASGRIQLAGHTCHLTVERETDGRRTEVRTYTTDVDDRCVCPTFCGEGCVPEVLAVENGALTVGAYAEGRDALSRVMEQVRERAEDVRLERLTSARGTASPGETDSQREAPGEVRLTEKQREAVAVAVEMGYYDDPRSATLADLADRLNVTRSALSQRLNAVETKLVTSLVGGR